MRRLDRHERRERLHGLRQHVKRLRDAGRISDDTCNRIRAASRFRANEVDETLDELTEDLEAGRFDDQVDANAIQRLETRDGAPRDWEAFFDALGGLVERLAPVLLASCAA